MIRSSAQRENLLRAQQPKGTGFGAAHQAFFPGLQIVVTGEVEPAMDDVKEEFGGEGGLGARSGLAKRGIDRNTDLARGAVGGVAFEGDNVGDGRVVEERGVEFGEDGVGEEYEREFAGGAGRDF